MFGMTTATPLRQKSGQPIGGQFATQERPDADFALADHRPESGGLSNREILSTSIELARISAHRVGLSREDTEDIAQETVLSVLVTRSKNGGQPVDGGLIRVVSRALVSRRVDTHRRHEDSRAFARWKLESERIQAERGSALSERELNDLAAQIREKWENPRHRPSVGFQHETKFVSSDAMGAAYGDTMANPVHYSATGAVAAHNLADQLEAGEMKKDEAKRRLWNALSEDTGTVVAVEGSLEPKVVRAHIKTVAGDAVSVARAWAAGDADAAQTTALFAPFGRTTDDEKHAIAIAITSRPSTGHRLWESAIEFSNTKHVAAAIPPHL